MNNNNSKPKGLSTILYVIIVVFICAIITMLIVNQQSTTYKIQGINNNFVEYLEVPDNADVFVVGDTILVRNSNILHEGDLYYNISNKFVIKSITKK